MRDYIPEKESEFDIWERNFMAYVRDNGYQWDIEGMRAGAPDADGKFERFVEQGSIFDELLGLQREYHEIKIITDNKELRNSGAVALKNEKKEAYIHGIRDFVQGEIMRNKKVKEDDFKNMRLTPHKTKYTHIKAQEKFPIFRVGLKQERQIELYFHTTENSKAKPYGTAGVWVSYGIFDEQPAEQDKLPISELAPQPHHVLYFKEEDRGKTVFIAVRWINRNGKFGPWSNFLSAIIP